MIFGHFERMFRFVVQKLFVNSTAQLKGVFDLGRIKRNLIRISSHHIHSCVQMKAFSIESNVMKIFGFELSLLFSNSRTIF